MLNRCNVTEALNNYSKFTERYFRSIDNKNDILNSLGLTEEELYNAVSIYSLYTVMRAYSIEIDYYLRKDNLINDSIPELNELFKDQNISNDLNSKDILSIIRSSFSHNDPKSNYLIFNDDYESIIINKKVNVTENLNLKLNVNLINQIDKILEQEIKGNCYLSIRGKDKINYESNDLFNELSKVKECIYVTSNKLDETKMQEFLKLSNSRIDLNNESLNNLSQKMNENARELYQKEFAFDLTDDQKNTIVNLMEQFKKNIGVFSIEDFLDQMIYSISPYPFYKYILLNIQNYISQYIMYDPNYKYSNVLSDFVETLYDKKIPINVSKSLLLNYSLKNIFVGYPKIMYIDYVINECIKDEVNININDVTYEIKSIRNSLTHGKWYINDKNEIVMYDGDLKNINIDKINNIGNINIDNLKLWCENYMKKEYNFSKKEKQKVKYKIINFNIDK